MDRNGNRVFVAILFHNVMTAAHAYHFKPGLLEGFDNLPAGKRSHLESHQRAALFATLRAWTSDISPRDRLLLATVIKNRFAEGIFDVLDGFGFGVALADHARQIQAMNRKAALFFRAERETA